MGHAERMGRNQTRTPARPLDARRQLQRGLNPLAVPQHFPPQCCGSGRRHAGALLHLGRHPACVSAAHPQASSVKPTFTVTCQYATLPSRTWPRVSTTSNQLILRTVSLARSIAVHTASSILVVDEPVSSMLLYTRLLMMRYS